MTCSTQAVEPLPESDGLYMAIGCGTDPALMLGSKSFSSLAFPFGSCVGRILHLQGP